MKKEIGILKPEFLTEDWPGKYKTFSWLEYVVTVPNPIFLITTLKENGKANACLHSWGLLLGEEDRFMSLIAVMKHGHTYQNIKNEKEWCINYPQYQDYPQSFDTIENNDMENDEIIDSGFHKEKPKRIHTPRIKECLANLECTFEWEKDLFPNSNWSIISGEVVHVAMEEKVMAPIPEERMKALGLMYNIRSTINPLDGTQYGPNTLGIINEVKRITSDDGFTKLWKS